MGKVFCDTLHIPFPTQDVFRGVAVLIIALSSGPLSYYKCAAGFDYVKLSLVSIGTRLNSYRPPAPFLTLFRES